MRGRRVAAAAAAVAVCAAGLAGCSRTITTNSMEQLRERGSITVGFAGEAPYSYMEDGELTGASVALHREIFRNLGIDEIDGVRTAFGSLIPGLQAFRWEAVSAGMSILPQRCAQASFSEPEFMYTTALMVREGNPLGLSDMQSVVDSGASLATMTGAVESDYAAELGINATQVAAPQDGMDAVIQGRADVFALTGISLNWMAQNRPDAPVEVTESFVAVINGVPQVGAGGTVFRTNDEDLLAAYNEELLKITSDVDRYLEIVGPFGFTEQELPEPGLTAAQLCEGVEE